MDAAATIWRRGHPQRYCSILPGLITSSTHVHRFLDDEHEIHTCCRCPRSASHSLKARMHVHRCGEHLASDTSQVSPRLLGCDPVSCSLSCVRCLCAQSHMTRLYAGVRLFRELVVWVKGEAIVASRRGSLRVQSNLEPFCKRSPHGHAHTRGMRVSGRFPLNGVCIDISICT